MKTYNKKIIFVVLAAILLIAIGFVVGSMRNKKVNETTPINRNSSIAIPSVQDSIQSSFFAELRKEMQNYNEGTPITIQLISYDDKIAVINYANSQESSAYLTIDFANNKTYQTKFSNIIGYGFIPILIAGKNMLVATNSYDQIGSTDIEIALTDLQGNIIKILKKFNISNSASTTSFYYGTEFGKNLISILGQRYTLDPNYDLIPVK